MMTYLEPTDPTMGQVLGMPGCSASPKARIAQPDVVALLESYLERAKAGEVCAIGIAAVLNEANGFGTSTQWNAGSAPGNMLLAVVCGLEARVKAAWLEMQS